VGEVEGKGDRETDNDGNRDDKVGRAGTVHVFSESSPGDGLRVERLHLLTRPNIRSLDVKEELSM